MIELNVRYSASNFTPYLINWCVRKRLPPPKLAASTVRVSVLAHSECLEPSRSGRAR
jgi:hypothetical protein